MALSYVTTRPVAPRRSTARTRGRAARGPADALRPARPAVALTRSRPLPARPPRARPVESAYSIPRRTAKVLVRFASVRETLRARLGRRTALERAGDLGSGHRQPHFTVEGESCRSPTTSSVPARARPAHPRLVRLGARAGAPSSTTSTATASPGSSPTSVASVTARGEQGDQSLEESARDLLAVADELGAEPSRSSATRWAAPWSSGCWPWRPTASRPSSASARSARCRRPFDDAGRGALLGRRREPRQPLRHHRLHDRQPQHADLRQPRRRLVARALRRRRLRPRARRLGRRRLRRRGAGQRGARARRPGRARPGARRRRPSSRPGCRSSRTRGSRSSPTPVTTRCSRRR